MKPVILISLAISLFINYCDLVQNPDFLSQKYLFEIQYHNSSWGFSHDGLFIDNSGYVYNYHIDNIDDYLTFERDNYYKETLDAKYNYNKKLLGKVDQDIVLNKFNLIDDAINSVYSDTSYDCCDKGDKSYICFTLTDDIYNKYVLKNEDGSVYKLENEYADSLINWLKSIEIKYKIIGTWSE